MHRVRLAVVIAVLAVLAIAGTAYAPYHTQAPSSTAPSGGAAFKAAAKTAAAHAGFAADGGTVSYAREHLGHVIVCIEGPKGKNVNSAWENPCQGQGNGVLADLAANRNAKSWLLVAKAADGLAVAGLKAANLAEIKNAAKGVSELMALIAEVK